MLDIAFIRANKELIKQNTANRLATVDIDQLLNLDEAWRKQELIIQELRAQRNKTSKSKPGEAEIKEMKKIGEQIAAMESEQKIVEESVKNLLLIVPNLSHPEVVMSDNDEKNPIMEQVGKIPHFNFTVKDHVELAEMHDLIDFERGTKVTGAKFYYLKNELVLLSQALNRYALEIAMKHGFVPMITPDLARTEIVEGLGFNPRGESSQIYRIANEDLNLIGTAEISLGGYHAEEVVDLQKGPKKYVGLSHCFRTEAGAASKYSKGIFRVHQFEKLEMFVYARPEESEKIHHEMLKIQKEIMSELGFTFRVIDHCSADLSTPAYRTFDLEAWLPGKPNKKGEKGDWAEITSVSNCTDYQARSLHIKYFDQSGNKKLVHTLNGTAHPGARLLIAILENYQTKNGSIDMPKVLRKYLPFKKIGR